MTMNCYLPLLLLVISNSLLLSVHGLPYLQLRSRSQKCVGLSPPRNTNITISYHFPDIIVMAEDPEDTEKEKKVQMENPNIPADKLSQRYAERYQKKMELMKKMGKRMNDVSITMYQRFSNPVAATGANRPKDADRGSVRIRLEILEKHGNFTFMTSPDDEGPTEVCVHSMTASKESPSRFAFVVEMNPRQSVEDVERRLKEEKATIGGHVSRMEQDLNAMIQKAIQLVRMGDSIKEQENEFHTKSVKINEASHFWPLLHLVVLVITGIVQASHVTRFFKKHNIVY